MTILKQQYEKIINDIDVGNSVAEHDNLLKTGSVPINITKQLMW